MNSEFCGKLEYTLHYVSGPICDSWDSNSNTQDCTKSKSLVIMEQYTAQKFTIDPSQFPLFITNPHGATTPHKWYDHSLLTKGLIDHEFRISVNWIPSTTVCAKCLP